LIFDLVVICSLFVVEIMCYYSIFTPLFVVIVIMLCTDTSQQRSKAEDHDGGLSPVNSVACCF